MFLNFQEEQIADLWNELSSNGETLMNDVNIELKALANGLGIKDLGRFVRIHILNLSAFQS